MNEQLQTALAELITSALQAKEFIVGELPEVVRQSLVWNMVYSALATATAMVFLSCCVFIGIKLGSKMRVSQRYKLEHKQFYDYSDVMLEWMLFVGVAGIAIAVFCGLFDLDWLQILIAPKVWLIEYAASLVK